MSTAHQQKSKKGESEKKENKYRENIHDTVCSN